MSNMSGIYKTKSDRQHLTPLASPRLSVLEPFLGGTSNLHFAPLGPRMQYAMGSSMKPHALDTFNTVTEWSGTYLLSPGRAKQGLNQDGSETWPALLQSARTYVHWLMDVLRLFPASM